MKPLTWEQFYSLATQRAREAGITVPDYLRIGGFVEKEVEDTDAYAAIFDIFLSRQAIDDESNRLNTDDQREIKELMNKLVVPSKIKAVAEKLELMVEGCIPGRDVCGIETPNFTQPTFLSGEYSLDWYRAMISGYLNGTPVVNIEVVVNLYNVLRNLRNRSGAEKDTRTIPITVSAFLPVFVYEAVNGTSTERKKRPFIEETNKLLSKLWEMLDGLIGEGAEYFCFIGSDKFAEGSGAIDAANEALEKFAESSKLSSYKAKPLRVGITAKQLADKRKAPYSLGIPLIAGYGVTKK